MSVDCGQQFNESELYRNHKCFERAHDTSIIDHLAMSFDEFESLCSSGDVQSAWNSLKETLSYCGDKYVPNRIQNSGRITPGTQGI